MVLVGEQSRKQTGQMVFAGRGSWTQGWQCHFQAAVSFSGCSEQLGGIQLIKNFRGCSSSGF